MVTTRHSCALFERLKLDLPTLVMKGIPKCFLEHLDFFSPCLNSWDGCLRYGSQIELTVTVVSLLIKTFPFRSKLKYLSSNMILKYMEPPKMTQLEKSRK